MGMSWGGQDLWVVKLSVLLKSTTNLSPGLLMVGRDWGLAGFINSVHMYRLQLEKNLIAFWGMLACTKQSMLLHVASL